VVRIKDVRALEVSTTLKYDRDFWEERLIRPIDIYPEHDADGPYVLAEGTMSRINKNTYKIRGIFVKIETDEGLSSVFWTNRCTRRICGGFYNLAAFKEHISRM